MKAHEVIFDRSGIPLKYRGVPLASWKPYNAASEAALAASQAFVDSWDRRRVTTPPEGSRELVGQGIAWVGSAGSGKTTLACLTAGEIITRYGQAAVVVPYADLYALMTERNRIGKLLDRGDVQAIDRYWEIDTLIKGVSRKPFVIFDDVGKERHTGSGYAEDEFDRILRFRFRNALPTGVTSNIPFEKWGKLYNPSMESFIYEAFVEVKMGGRDLRRGRVLR